LLLSVAAAFAVALVLLVTTILPAEYGIDPLGTGRLLGLTAISAGPTLDDMPPPPPVSALMPVHEGPVAHFAAEYKTDTATFIIDPYQYVEYKYRLEKGATMLYAWTASVAPIYDFHADPDGDPKPDPVSFDKQSKTEARGSFTAPFSGIHGWSWENPGGEPMTIRLTTAGFYTAATEFRSPRVRRDHPLTPLATSR
jgi:hypothetical protein